MSGRAGVPCGAAAARWVSQATRLSCAWLAVIDESPLSYRSAAWRCAVAVAGVLALLATGVAIRGQPLQQRSSGGPGRRRELRRSGRARPLQRLSHRGAESGWSRCRAAVAFIVVSRATRINTSGSFRRCTSVGDSGQRFDGEDALGAHAEKRRAGRNRWFQLRARHYLGCAESGHVGPASTIAGAATASFVSVSDTHGSGSVWWRAATGRPLASSRRSGSSWRRSAVVTGRRRKPFRFSQRPGVRLHAADRMDRRRRGPGHSLHSMRARTHRRTSSSSSAALFSAKVRASPMFNVAVK